MIVLDTHVWVWWVSGSQSLPKKVQASLEEAVTKREVRVSSISAWEVAQLVANGRLELTMDAADWIEKSEALPFLEFVPVDNRITVRSTRLPGSIHPDPADRIIAATARCINATLVTADRRLIEYAHQGFLSVAEV